MDKRSQFKICKAKYYELEREFRSFFKGQSGFPKFKKKGKSDGKM